jgi:hypothetical protein
MKYVLSFFLLLILSCESKNKFVNEIIEIDYKNLHTIQLSDYVRNVKVVKLETSSDVLIGEIIKVQIFNRKIYVLDMSSNALFIFTENGKFLNKLHKTGQGPGEYRNLFDFTVTDKGLYLLDLSGAILRYDSENPNYLGKIAHYTVSTAFTTDDSYFWVLKEPAPPDHRVLMFDTTSKLVKEFFPRDANVKEAPPHLTTNVFQVYANDIYFSTRYGNTFYKWQNDEWQSFLTVSFGDKTLSENIHFDFDVEDYITKESYFVTSDLLIFRFFADSHINFCFHNLKTHQYRFGKVENDIMPHYTRFMPTWQSGNYLIEHIYAEHLLNGSPNMKNLDNLKDLTEDDNPVLVIYELF